MAFLRGLFYLYNYQYFPLYPSSILFKVFMTGMLTDTQSIAILFFPFLFIHLLPFRWQAYSVIQRLARLYYLFMAACILVLSLSEMAYFPFSFQRLHFGTFLLIADSPVFTYFIRHYWYLLVVFFVAFYLLVRAYNFSIIKAPQLAIKYYPGYLTGACFVIFFAITGGRSRPLMPSDLSLYVPANATLLATNTTQNILFTMYLNKFRSRRMLEHKDYMPKEEAEKRVKAFYRPPAGGTFKDYNIVVFVLESFSRGYLEPGNSHKAITPFLDSLRGESLVCTNAFANASISLGGLTSILGSIPPFTAASHMESPYANNFILPFGEVLQTMGYSTHFFYGSENDHFGFNRLANQLGVTNSYGRAAFGDDSQYDGVWGIYDGPFFSFAASTLGTIKPPFAAVIFNLSSHFPYAIPAQYANLLPKGKLVSHQSITYVDICLRQFIAEAKKASWYKKSIFVFVADHWSKEDNAHMGTGPQRFAIPLMFFFPDGSYKGTYDKVADQLSIAPTLADMMHLPVPFTAFGSSLLDTAGERYSYSLQEFPFVYQAIGDSMVLVYNEYLEKVVSYYNYRNGEQTEMPEILPAAGKKMEQYLKAFIQVHHNAMLDNKLMPEP